MLYASFPGVGGAVLAHKVQTASNILLQAPGELGSALPNRLKMAENVIFQWS